MLGAVAFARADPRPASRFLVLYSSATTTLGNPGQGSYVAANMYLESLAECRRRLGLPALTVGWGPIGDVGFLARNERVRDALVARNRRSVAELGASVEPTGRAAQGRSPPEWR